jgi:hypothetical protein
MKSLVNSKKEKGSLNKVVTLSRGECTTLTNKNITQYYDGHLEEEAEQTNPNCTYPSCGCPHFMC